MMLFEQLGHDSGKDSTLYTEHTALLLKLRLSFSKFMKGDKINLIIIKKKPKNLAMNINNFVLSSGVTACAIYRSKYWK